MDMTERDAGMLLLLQLLLGGHAGQGQTLEREGLVASIVARRCDS